jgi:hypothetical protein
MTKRKVLRGESQQSGRTGLTRAVPSTAAAERDRFLREYERAHAGLARDPITRRDVEAERSSFEGTLMDGLEDEPA